MRTANAKELLVGIIITFLITAIVLCFLMGSRDTDVEASPDVTTESIAETTSIPETAETIPATEPTIVETEPIEVVETVAETQPETKPAKKTTVKNKKAAEKIYNYITQELGYSDAAACGIVANIAYETGWKFNPTAGSADRCYGLIQWLGGRLKNLKSWCKKNGKDYKTMEGQLDFMDYELKNTYTYGTYEALFDCENDIDGAYEAGWYFCYWYERPNNKKKASVNRGNEAKKYFKALVLEG